MAQDDTNGEQWDEFFAGLDGAGNDAFAEVADDVVAAMARHQDELMHYPNVLAVAPGYRQRTGRPVDEQCLVVYVTEKLPPEDLPPEGVIPSHVDGVPVDVVGVGEIRPQVI